MFRKSKGPDGGQGYNRISRLIAERQRELTEGGPADEGLDDDTIVMPAAGDDHPEDTVSLIGLRGGTTAPAVQQTPAGAASGAGFKQFQRSGITCRAR